MAHIQFRNTKKLRPVTVYDLRIAGFGGVGEVVGEGDAEEVGPFFEFFG